jgi:hypothetical protein
MDASNLFARIDSLEAHEPHDSTAFRDAMGQARRHIKLWYEVLQRINDSV